MCPQSLISFLTHAPAIALALLLESFPHGFNLTRNCRREIRNLQQVGWQHYQHQRWVESEQTFQQMLVLQRTVGDAVGVADTLNLLGAIAYQRNELAQAVNYYQQAFRLSQSVHYSRGMGASASNIGWIYRQVGRWSWALCAYQHALRAYVETDDYATVGQTLYMLGAIYADADQLEQAQQYYGLASQILKETLNGLEKAPQNSVSHIPALHSVDLFQPSTNSRLGQWDTGHFPQRNGAAGDIAVHDEVRLSRAIASRTSRRTHKSLSVAALNAVISPLHRSPEMLETCKSLSDLRQEATTLHAIAALYQRDGLYLSALAYEKQALSIFQLLGDSTETDQILHNLGKIHERLGHRKTAMKYYGQVLKNLFKLMPAEEEYSPMNA